MPGSISSSSSSSRTNPRSGGASSNASVKRPYSDDDYMQMIAQYSNQPWYSQLLTNPWLWKYQGQYSYSLIDNLAGMFGDNSNEERYINEIVSNRNQWLSEFLEKMRQQDYDSPAQQVARQKAAGLNPDLNGSVTSGSAAENDQPLQALPDIGVNDSVQQLSSFIMNIYSLASGFAKDRMSLQSMQNDVLSGDLDVVNKITSSASDYIKSSAWLSFVNADDGGSGEYSVQFPDDDRLSEYANKMFRSRSARKRFIKEVKEKQHGAQAQFSRFGVMKDAQSAKSALSKILAENEVRGDNELNPMIIVAKELSRLNYDIEKEQKRYTFDYYRSADGSKAGQAESDSNDAISQEVKARSYLRSMDGVLNRTMSRMISKLEKSANSGGIESLISQGMLLYLSAFRLQMMPSLPSVNLKGLVDNRTMIFDSSK